MFPRITHTRATQGPPGCGNNDEVLLPVHSIHSLTPAALSRRISVDMMGYLNVKLVFLSLSRSLPLALCPREYGGGICNNKRPNPVGKSSLRSTSRTTTTLPAGKHADRDGCREFK